MQLVAKNLLSVQRRKKIYSEIGGDNLSYTLLLADKGQFLKNEWM